MDRKEAFDIVLAQLPEDKRKEAVDRLREVDTRAQKLEILKDYGIEINSPEDVLGDNWEDDSENMTAEQLAAVSGGCEAPNSGFTWDRDCNCEP